MKTESIVKYVLRLTITLLLITFIPDISLLIPRLLGGYVPQLGGIFG